MLDLLEVVTDLLCHRADLSDDLSDSLVDTTLKIHGVSTCGDVLQPDTDDALGKDSRRGRTVTSIVVGLRSDLLDELSTHILEWIFELDLLSYGDTVLGDVGCAVGLTEDDVATLRAEGYLDSVSQSVNAALEALTCLYIELDFFCHDRYIVLLSFWR